MIDKKLAIAYLWIIPIALTFNVFVMEPHLFTHITNNHRQEMMGQKDIVIFLDMFTVFVSLLIGAMKTDD